MPVVASEASSGFLKSYRLGRSSCWSGEGEGARVESGCRTGSSGGASAGDARGSGGVGDRRAGRGRGGGGRRRTVGRDDRLRRGAPGPGAGVVRTAVVGD